MAKYYGKIGYVEKSVETTPGVWGDRITERTYTGDITRNASGWNSSTDSTNDNLTINNQISIVADQFAYQNSRLMKYVEFMGVKWNITNIEFAQRPRIILTLGGEYNGK